MGTLPRPLLGALVAVVALFAVWTVFLKPHSSSPDANGVSVVHAYKSAIAKLHAAEAGKAQAAAGTVTKVDGHHAALLDRHPVAPAVSTPHVDGHHAALLNRRPHTQRALPAVHPAVTATVVDGHHGALLDRRRPISSATIAAAESTAVAAATTPSSKPAHATPVVPARNQVAQLDSALRAGKVIALLFYNPHAADDLAVRRSLAAVPARPEVAKLAVPISDLSRFGVVTNEVPVTASPTVVVIDRQHRASTLVGFVDQLELDQLVATALAAK